jgi:RNAse (barnase) inhibitor barstar
MNLEIKDKGHFFIASIDGKKCQTWDSFLREIGIAFNFPDYYGQNLHAFRDCINDLGWIENENYMLIINNSDLLLKDGLEPDDQEYIRNEFQEISEQWANVPEQERDYRKNSKFIVVYN